MARRSLQRLDGWTTLWLSLAAIWSLGLVADALFFNSYNSTDAPSETLVQANGVKVLIPLLIPFVCVVIVSRALGHRRRAQIAGVGALAWVMFGLLTLFVGLGALSIGPFIAPVTVFVVLAITHEKGRNQLVRAVTERPS